MTTSQAVQYVLTKFGWSKYKLAQQLGCAPTSIDQWLRNTKMSLPYRKLFHEQFGIRINDK